MDAATVSRFYLLESSMTLVGVSVLGFVGCGSSECPCEFISQESQFPFWRHHNSGSWSMHRTVETDRQHSGMANVRDMLYFVLRALSRSLSLSLSLFLSLRFTSVAFLYIYVIYNRVFFSFPALLSYNRSTHIFNICNAGSGSWFVCSVMKTDCQHLLYTGR